MSVESFLADLSLKLPHEVSRYTVDPLSRGYFSVRSLFSVEAREQFEEMALCEAEKKGRVSGYITATSHLLSRFGDRRIEQAIEDGIKNHQARQSVFRR